MAHDLWRLYALMLRCRRFEEATARLWQEGRISGEMHLGTGEEAIIAGVVVHLGEGDALALDHRPSAAMLMRGIDPVALMREMLGRPDGLCAGMGGHMHLFSKDQLAASSGIVGASGPAAAGFGLAAQLLRPGAVAVAFFGEGAMNQGQLLESLNLAAAWKLPVLFVCKDDGWAITTQDSSLTRGNLDERARGLGVPVVVADGREVVKVWEAAGKAIEGLRAGEGPVFLHARCVHFEGHFLGFQLIRAITAPFKEIPASTIPLTRAFFRPGGGSLRERLAGLKIVMGSLLATLRDARREASNDPLRRARAALQNEPERLQELEEQIEREIQRIVAAATAEVAL